MYIVNNHCPMVYGEGPNHRRVRCETITFVYHRLLVPWHCIAHRRLAASTEVRWHTWGPAGYASDVLGCVTDTWSWAHLSSACAILQMYLGPTNWRWKTLCWIKAHNYVVKNHIWFINQNSREITHTLSDSRGLPGSCSLGNRRAALLLCNVFLTLVEGMHLSMTSSTL